MSRPRVLFVDDSVVVRRLVSRALEQDESVELVGVAADGQIALEKIARLDPDVVILDVEMPVMDGLTALKEIRRRWPRLPVIMFSTLTERGGRVTLDALALGASDYATKPKGGDPAKSTIQIREALIPKIFGLCGAVSAPHLGESLRPGAKPGTPMARPFRRRIGPPERVDAIAIAVSTGGPNALVELIPALPPDLPIPVFIIQHMPETFTKLLAERLDSKSGLPVVEASDGEVAEAPGVWLAPGDRHMTVERGSDGLLAVHVFEGPHENSCRPSADPLFRSVADVFGSRAIGVVLTGMGSDGLKGAERMRAAGGQILAQDEASSVVWGMPGFVVRAGIADAVVPLKDMAEEIVRRASAGRPPLRERVAK